MILPSPRRIVPTLSGLFVLSGFAGLTYQVLWFRLLSLVFGVTVYAATTALACFMAGLAVGSFAAGPLQRRIRQHPLRVLAAAEFGIAALALCTPVALHATQAAYVAVHPQVGGMPGARTLFQFLSAAAVLIPPTILMGLTLPCAVAAATDGEEPRGRVVALLYAANTAGAVAGTLTTGFVLIGGVGIWRSFFIAAALNLLAATGVLLLSAGRGVRGVAPPRHAMSRSGETPLSVWTRRAALIALTVSGLASLALEVIWFRVLVLFVPATTYAFTTMLAAVLTGLAAGSLAVERLLGRDRDWLAWLSMTQAAIGVVVLWSVWALPLVYLPGSGAWRLVQTTATGILPAALLMGAAFPIGARIWLDGAASHEEISSRMGILSGLNVAAGIAGAVSAGFFLLPGVGSRASITVLGALYVASAAGVVLLLRRRQRLLLGAAALIALFVAGAIVLPNPATSALALRSSPRERLLWWEEGVQTTVSVNVGATGRRSLYLDGLHQANDDGTMVRVHRQIGHLATILHPHPRRALVVGLGGGATAGAVSQCPGIQVDVVELSSAVARGAAWFSHVNYDVLRQPNVTIRIGDGRNHLMLTGNRYDIVTADVIQPIHAGAGNVYSREYFEIVRDALADDGVVVQWIGRRPRVHYEAMMRTFASVFPHASVWADGTLLVGTKRPLVLDPATFEARTADARWREAIAQIGVGSFDDLAAMYTGGPGEIRRFVGTGPVLTDDRPLVEYFLSLPGTDHPDYSRLRGNVRQHLPSPVAPAATRLTQD